MLDILMIALQFAPVQSTGAFRSIEFATRLADHGIRLTVLTIDPEQASIIFDGKISPGMSQRLSRTVDVHYLREKQTPVREAPLPRLLRMLSTFDDTFESRFAPALAARLAELKQGSRRFAAVYATAPPFGAAMLGKQAAEELRVPFILDMRDAWAQWSPAPQISRLHYARKHQDEARAFAAADAIVGVTPELSDLFAASHPGLPRSRFHTITNGISGVGELPPEALWVGTGETVDIGYVGSFYWTPPKAPSLRAPHRYLQYNPRTEDWSYRSPLPFFRAWAELDKLAPVVGARLRFHHVGHAPDWLMPMAAEHGVADRCLCHGVLARQNVAGFLDSMTGLLGTSMKRPGGLDYCLASKSFEYLASGKPTLAFVCAGAQKRFFEEVGGAMIFDPDDPRKSAMQLQALAGKSRRFAIRKEALLAYDHDFTSAQMAALIHRVALKTAAGGTADVA